MPDIPTRSGTVSVEDHRARWGAGCGHSDCDKARHIILGKGMLPCDLLFVGMCPGESEDFDRGGRPFVGPAGHFLDKIIKNASRGITLCEVCGSYQFSTPSGETCKNGHGGAGGRLPRYAYTNLVCCLPRDDDGKKMHDPSIDHILSCRPRLQEFIDCMAKPRVVVCVGETSKTWFRRGFKDNVKLPKSTGLVDILHPSYILRRDAVEHGVLGQRCAVTVTNTLEDL